MVCDQSKLGTSQIKYGREPNYLYCTTNWSSSAKYVLLSNILRARVKYQIGRESNALLELRDKLV